MFTPRLAIFYLATILRFTHVRGVRTVLSAVTHLFLHHHRDGGIIWTELALVVIKQA